MKNVDVYLVSSFSVNGRGGNPAGVVLNADHLSDEEKLKIAKDVGYSETAFVCRDDEVDFAVSFFTTTDEVDFCGHATLAAFSTLFKQGVIGEGRYVQRTKAGILAVAIESSGHVVMEQKQPEYLGELSCESLAECLSVDSAVITSTQLPIEIVSTGLADIIVPVAKGYLDKIRINESLLSEFSKKHNVIGVHAFELCEQSAELTASCRNFAPLFGIPEESATGSASGALACYLTKHLNGERSRDFVFEQGRAMNCASRITASIESDNQAISKVRVGGFAHEIGQRKVAV